MSLSLCLFLLGSVSFFSSLSLPSRPCPSLLVSVSFFSSLSLPSRLCLILPVSIKIPVSVSFCLVLVPRLSTVDSNLYHLSVAYTPLSGLQVSRFSICPTTICIIPSQPTSPHRYIPPQTRSSSLSTEPGNLVFGEKIILHRLPRIPLTSWYMVSDNPRPRLSWFSPRYRYHNIGLLRGPGQTTLGNLSSSDAERSSQVSPSLEPSCSSAIFNTTLICPFACWTLTPLHITKLLDRWSKVVF